jgi:SNF2 family DNA or RNA helicase
MLYTCLDDRLMGALGTFLEAEISPRDYQEDGISWMFRQEQQGEGGILADDPGLGKTLQTMALCDNWTEGDSPTLIVVPTSIIEQWADIARQLYGFQGVYLHHGRGRDPAYWDLPTTRIVLTTYGLLLHDKSLQTKHWARAVLDEIHYIKNHRGKTARLAYSLLATYRWGLSGTPVQNRPNETKALFRFVLGLDEDARATDLILEELIQTHLLRRTKTGHLRLPEVTIQNSEVDFATQEEARFYQRVQTNVSQEFHDLLELGGEARDENMMMFELLLRLRQASCHPQLVLNGLARKYDITATPWDGVSSKHTHLLQLLQGHPGESALVFCQFTEEMDLLQALLGRNALRVQRLDGGMSETQRRTTLELASTPGAVDVFLIQIRAGGVGLNLQEFSRVYLTSPDWNPCNEIQAIARAHRMGQQRAVVVTKLVLSGFVTGDDPTTVTPTSVIDNRILEVQQRKRMLMSDLLEEPDLANNGTRRRLTRTDWKKLLK